jgi:hypothetical protein
MKNENTEQPLPDRLIPLQYGCNAACHLMKICDKLIISDLIRIPTPEQIDKTTYNEELPNE